MHAAVVVCHRSRRSGVTPCRRKACLEQTAIPTRDNWALSPTRAGGITTHAPRAQTRRTGGHRGAARRRGGGDVCDSQRCCTSTPARVQYTGMSVHASTVHTVRMRTARTLCTRGRETTPRERRPPAPAQAEETGVRSEMEIPKPATHGATMAAYTEGAAVRGSAARVLPVVSRGSAWQASRTWRRTSRARLLSASSFSTAPWAP